MGRFLSAADVIATRLPSHVATSWGDSRPTAVYNDNGSTSKGNRSPLVWANVLSGQRLIIGPNFSVAGERSDQALARVPAVIASGAGLCHVWVGLNDIAQNYPTAATSGATAAANTIAALEQFRSAGIICVVEAEMGSAGLNAAQVIQVATYNAIIYDYCERSVGVYFHDARSIVMNPTFSTTLIGGRAGYFYDNPAVHEACRAAFYHGRSLAALIQAIVPPRFGVPLIGNVEQFTAGGYQLVTNPNFNTVAGGTVGAGISGNVPAAWIAVCSGGATATLTSQVDPTGNGNSVLAAITFTAAGETFRLHQSPSVNTWNIGDNLEAAMAIDVTGNPTGLSGTYLELICSTDASKTARDCFAVSSNDLGPDIAYSAQLKTRPFTVTGTTKAFLNTSGYVVASGAGSVNVTFKQGLIRKRPSAPF